MELGYDENAKSNREPIPNGLYCVEVDEIEFTKSREKQKDMCRVVFRVCEGPEGAKDPALFRGRKVFENYMCDQKWRMNHLFLMAKSAGLEQQYFKDFDQPGNHGRLVNRQLKVRVIRESRKDGKGDSNRVDGENYFPWTGKQAPAGVESPASGPAAPTQGKLPFEENA